MKKGTLSRRKAQGAETKERIRRTAEKLFSECGIDNVSVDTIVDAAGVSKGTFYVHFESKDALISSLISEYVDRVDMDYGAFIKSLPADMPASDVLLALAGKIFDVLEGAIGHEHMRTLYKVQLTGLAKAQRVMSYDRALYEMLRDVLETGIRQGEFVTSLPVDRLGRHLLMAMRGITYEWCVRYPDFNLKEQALEHFEMLLAGIRTRGHE